MISGASAVQDESDGSVNMFGPLLAMRAGHHHTVQLQNKLTAPVNDSLVSFASSCSPVKTERIMLMMSAGMQTRHYQHDASHAMMPRC